MILASRVIGHYKGLARIPPEEVEENYDDKPLPPVPPHQPSGAVLGARHGRGGSGRSNSSKSSGVRFGSIETKEVPRTMRKDASLEQYAPTPPRPKKRLFGKQRSESFERDYEISAKYAQRPAAAEDHIYMPSPAASGPRRVDERRQVRRHCSVLSCEDRPALSGEYGIVLSLQSHLYAEPKFEAKGDGRNHFGKHYATCR